MHEQEVYNKVNLLQEAKRYKTTLPFLELLYQEINGSKKIFLDCLGPRLFTTVSALAEETHGIDINQGSIDRTYEFIDNLQQYMKEYPFKNEFSFLKDKKLTPNFKNFYFQLASQYVNRPNTFNAELASELFLHLNNHQLSELLQNSIYRLQPEGKLIFTIYPSGHSESLDKKFLELNSNIKLKDFVDSDGTININTYARNLKQKAPSLHEEKKEEYWLDLQKVRMFNQNAINGLCRKYGFEIRRIENIRGGMFPFAERLAYSVVKK
jgi:hypothetical protein